ncbi:MAG: methylmalonyl-CoA epimerase [Anaerolineaceae bacterium]|nr:methylmalonyl-CoA epimerase [Anaerolineaceae bacterium]MBN2678080.1 methylmalonyl-CoA epimerase [Anaerolineaceae bacterium]
MATVKKINHVAVVVADIDASLGFWRDALGLPLHHVEDVPSQKAQVAFLPAGEGEVELVKPTSDDCGTAKFLRDKGPGMHHLCLEVDDIEGMLVQLKTRGVHMINETPVELPGRKMAFIHPKAADGVLVELYQLT